MSREILLAVLSVASIIGLGFTIYKVSPYPFFRRRAAPEPVEDEGNIPIE